MDAKLSYVVPVFNRTASLREAVASVLQQDSGPFEIIVVDDASTVDTRPSIADFEQQGLVKYTRLKQNLGPGGAKNHGIKMATGDYIVVLDSDDLIAPGAPKLIRTTISATSADLIFGNCLDDNGLPLSDLGEAVKTASYVDLLVRGAPGEFMPIIRREAFASLGFRTDLRGFEHITWLECAQAGQKIVFINQATRIYRMHGADRICAPANMARDYERLARGWQAHLAAFGDDLARYDYIKCILTIAKARLYTRACGNLGEAWREGVSRSLKRASLWSAPIRLIPTKLARRIVAARFQRT